MKPSLIKHGHLLLIIAAVLIGWTNSLFNGFALDDKAVITQNTLTRMGIKGIPELVTHDHFYGYNHAITGLYRPIPLATHALEYEIAGESAFTGHLVNLLLYISLCLILYSLLKGWLPEQPPLLPLAATLLFALHPLHTEVVANIKGRDDILNLIFLLLTAHFSLRWTQKRNPGQLILSLFFFILALLSKESAMTFLVVIPLSLWFFSGARSKQIVMVTAGMIAMAAIYLLIRAQFVDSSSEYRILDAYYQHSDSRPDRLATSTANLLSYLLLLIWPHPLIYDYSYNQIPVIAWIHPKTILSLLANLSLIIFALVTLPRKSIFSFAILCYFITLSVSANLITPTSAVFAERFLFIPSLFFSLAFALLLFRATIRLRNGRMLFTGLMAALLLAAGILTILRSGSWKDDETLFTRDLKHQTENATAHYNLATLWFNRIQSNPEGFPHEREKTIRLLTETFRIDSTFTDALFLRGILFFNDRSYRIAAADFERLALTRDQRARSRYPADTGRVYASQAWFRMGVASFNSQVYDSAIYYFRKASGFDPRNANTWHNIGGCFFNTGRHDSAVLYFRQAATLDSSFLTTYKKLGIPH